MYQPSMIETTLNDTKSKTDSLGVGRESFSLTCFLCKQLVYFVSQTRRDMQVIVLLLFALTDAKKGKKISVHFILPSIHFPKIASSLAFLFFPPFLPPLLALLLFCSSCLSLHPLPLSPCPLRLFLSPPSRTKKGK